MGFALQEYLFWGKFLPCSFLLLWFSLGNLITLQQITLKNQLKMKGKLKLNAIIEPSDEGGFIAFIEELPNVCTQGESLEEVKENLKDALKMLLDAQRGLSRKRGYKANTIREEFVLT